MVYSLKPDVLQQTKIVSGILSFFRWTHVMVIGDTAKPQLVYDFVKSLELLNPILMTVGILIDTWNSKDVAGKLAQVKKIDTPAIVLICENSRSHKVLIEAEELGLFNGDRAWIVSHAIVEAVSDLKRIQTGLLGMRLRNSCNSTEYSSLRDLLYDGLMVYVHAQKSFINEKGTIPSRKHPSCYGDVGNMDRDTAFFR